MRDQMGNQISTDATGHEGQNRAHVSHFRKSRQLFHKLRNMNRGRELQIRHSVELPKHRSGGW